jgi:hypothetical protein
MDSRIFKRLLGHVLITSAVLVGGSKVVAEAQQSGTIDQDSSNREERIDLAGVSYTLPGDTDEDRPISFGN